MNTARLILFFIIVITPITVIFDGLIIQGAIGAIVAFTIAIVSLRIRPGEARFFWDVIRPVAAVSAVPAIWMLLQLLPVQKIGLENSVWKSAAAALGRSLTGSITIDPGATVISFIRYLLTVSVLFITAAVAVERRRAQSLLFALLIATASIAGISLVITNSHSTFLTEKYSPQMGAIAADAGTLGIIFGLAAAFYIWNTGLRQHNETTLSASTWTILTCFISVITGVSAIVMQGTAESWYALIFGLAALAIVIIVRRYNLRAWGIAGIVSITLFAAIAFAAVRAGGHHPIISDAVIAFADNTSASEKALTQRILRETGWFGIGAGNFAAVVPIYQDATNQTAENFAPTTVAAVMIEMGPPFFWALAASAIAFLSVLFRSSLRRHRDWHYPAAGASCAVAVSLQAFCNSAALSTAVGIVVAAAFGIAIAQSKSRSV